MTKQFILTKDYYYLAAGTFLRRNVYGGYYVVMSDDMYKRSKITHTTTGPVLPAMVVETYSSIFEEVGKPETIDRSRLMEKILEWEALYNDCMDSPVRHGALGVLAQLKIFLEEIE